jgi:hypothetical protein
MTFKGLVRKRSWPTFKVPSRYSPGRTEENQGKPPGIQSPGRGLNPVSSEYNAGVLITQARRSVATCS